MKICVTGAAGFIGSHIQDALIEQGHQVLSIDNLSGGFRRNFNPKADVAVIDLTVQSALDYELQRFKPDVIYHCAANAREGASFFDPVKIVMANQVATINVLESAIKVGSMQKYIQFSSMATYGNQTPPFCETLRPAPVDVYGWAKYSMEECVKILADCHKFNYTIIRPHNVFGERQSLRDKYRNVIGIFMNRIMRREPIYIYGDGQQVRQFSYIANSVPCYITCVDQCNGEIINIGGTVDITVEQLARYVIEAMGEDQTYPVIYLRARYGEVKLAYCNPQKSIDLVGFTDTIGLQDGIRNMARWAKTLGAQDWIDEPLAIPNDWIPTTWKS